MRVLLATHIGFAESYMAGDWDSPDIGAVVAWGLHHIDSAPILEGRHKTPAWLTAAGLINRFIHYIRPNTRLNITTASQAHYDLSNAFFELFLDPRRVAVIFF